MLGQFILILGFLIVFIVAVVVVANNNPYKYKKVIYDLRSRFAPQAKVANFKFNFVYDNFPIEIGLWSEGRLSYSLRVALTGGFPKQKLFMYEYPLVADEVRWEKNKLTTNFDETLLMSEDTIHDAVVARLKVMVNVARELEARKV